MAGSAAENSTNVHPWKATARPTGYKVKLAVDLAVTVVPRHAAGTDTAGRDIPRQPDVYHGICNGMSRPVPCKSETNVHIIRTPTEKW